MKTQSTCLFLICPLFILVFACNDSGPDYRDNDLSFVYTAEYVDNFIGRANLFLEDSASYKQWFSEKPEMWSYYMLLNQEWPSRIFENRIEIKHDKTIEELTAGDIQRKIEAVRSGNPEAGHYLTYLDTFDTQSIHIHTKVKEWKDGKSEAVVKSSERIDFQKRKIGDAYAWIPILINQKLFKRSDYSWVSSYPNQMYLNPGTHLPEGEIKIYYAVAQCLNMNYCEISSRLNMYPNGVQYFSGAKIGGPLTIGDIRMKAGEIEFGLMGSRAATTENELLQGTKWRGVLYWSNSGKGIDSLTYAWEMRLDTAAKPFTTAPISPLIKDEE